MIILENEILKISLNKFGAELVSVIDKESQYEFIWQGQENNHYHPSVSFPIIGRLRNQQFSYQGQKFTLDPSGFAHKMEFNVQNVTENTASFYLKSDPSTLNQYPFQFSFQVNYILFDSKVTVSYEILNTSAHDDIYYNVGAHPNFKISQIQRGPQLEMDSISLSFEPDGHYLRYPLNKEGFIVKDLAKYMLVNTMQLDYPIFKKNPLIYQINAQTRVTLIDKKAKFEVEISPNGMEYLAVSTSYTDKEPYISIEPWSGLLDFDDSSGEIIEKNGINVLQAQKIRSHDFTLNFTKY